MSIQAAHFRLVALLQASSQQTSDPLEVHLDKVLFESSESPDNLWFYHVERKVGSFGPISISN